MSFQSRASRRGVRLAAVALVAVMVVAAAGLWYLLLRPAGPPPVSLATPGAPSGATAAASTATGSGSGSSSAAGGLAGTWTIDPSIGSASDNSDSFVGYRVEEQLANIGANTAVGRTRKVSGTLAFDGSTVTAVEITADLTALQSDSRQRDGQLHRQALETDTYPTATFKLAEPIALGSAPADGQTVQATAVGDLAIHGQTKRVTIALQAARSDDTVTVVGSIPIAFADYGMSSPRSFLVLSIADTGTMEFHLNFRKG